MYATVRNYTGTAGLADELVKREDDIRSIIQGISGFHSYYLIRTSDGYVVTVSVFDDQAGAEESTRAAADWMRANLPQFAGSPPQVLSGEVPIHF